MAGRSVDRLGMTRRRAVAAAVIRRAEMRAALQDLARYQNLGLARVVARVRRAAARVRRDAAGFGGVGFMPGRPPIGGPLPNVADHVVEAVAVRRKGADRRGSLVAVDGEVLTWKSTLPGVRHRPPGGRKLVASGKLSAL